MSFQRNFHSQDPSRLHTKFGQWLLRRRCLKKLKDNGWMTDACLYYKLNNENSAHVNLKSILIQDWQYILPDHDLKLGNKSNELIELH